MRFRAGVLPFFGWPHLSAGFAERVGLCRGPLRASEGAEPSPWTGRRIQIVSESSGVPERMAGRRAAGLKSGACTGLGWHVMNADDAN